MRNPFGGTGVYRYYLSYQYIHSGDTVIDVGCGDGKFICLVDKADKRYGCDVSKEALRRGRLHCPKVLFSEIKARTLPYKNSCADTVTLLEVIEHVVEKKFLIKEIRRILKPHGMLILSTPHAGISGWLDWGNMKYVFPSIHRWLIVTIHGEQYYKIYYQSGMYGDMDPRLTSHHHSTQQEIRTLLEENGFHIEDSQTYGLFLPILLPLRDIWKKIFGAWNPFNILIFLDALLFGGNIGYSMLVKATKK